MIALNIYDIMTWYRKTFSDVSERVSTIMCATWTQRNDVVFKNNEGNHNYVLKLANRNFYETMVYNKCTSVFACLEVA